MTKLIDQFGAPLQRKALLKEQAAPSVSGVRSILSKGVTAGLNPSKLAKILKASEAGDNEDFLVMAEELEEKDPHYVAVIGTRKRAVAQLEITVEAASDDAADVKIADFVRDWCERDQLQSEIFDMMDAVGKGYSVTEILWETSENQWLPKDLKWRDPRWFGFDEETGSTLMLKEGRDLVPLAPYQFIVHYHKAKSGLAVRGGVARPCAWMYLFKNFSIKDWVIFAEAYGQPIRIGKYGSGATQEDRDVLMRAVANIGSDAAAIIPESMLIEFVEAGDKKASAEVFERLGKFCDQQMSKAVLGQTTTVDAISGGHSVSKEHNEVREDIERADAIQIQGTLNNTLIPAIVTLNFGPDARLPRIRIGRTEDVDLEKLSNVADKAVRMGMKVSHNGLRDKLGLPAPEDDDDVIKLNGAPVAVDQKPEPAAQAIATAASKHNHKDIVDDLSGDLAENWEPVLNPVVEIIQQSLDQSKTYDEFSQNLLELAEELNVKGITQILAQANFTARISGMLEIAPDGEDNG